MKKQLMIAAVAASMSLSAMADISISGSSSATFTSTGTATTNSMAASVTITGTGGGATVVSTMDLTNGDMSDTLLSMNVMGVDVTTDGTDLTAGMTLGAYTVTYADGASSSSVTVGIDMGGMSASHKMPSGAGASVTSVSGSLGGIDVTYSTNGTNSNMSVAGGMGAITGSYSDVGFASDSADLGTTATATMDMGGNSVTLERRDNTVTQTTSASVGTTLAGGADLTATWSSDGSADTLELEVAVSF